MSLTKNKNNIEINSFYSYTNAGGEQTIFEITTHEKSYINQIMLDFINLTKNGIIKLYSKIDGITYREILIFAFTVLTDTKGCLINVKIPIDIDFKITYTEETDEGVARTIPYNYILGD
jgi:hypothetical protein